MKTIREVEEGSDLSVVDNGSTPEIEDTSSSTEDRSLSKFVVKTCRNFKLFPNENSTLLCDAELSQILQYSLSCFKEKCKKELKTDSSLVFKFRDALETSFSDKVFNLIKAGQEIDASKRAQADGNDDQKEKDKQEDEAENKTIIDAKDLNLTSDDFKDIQDLFDDFRMTSNHVTLAEMYGKFVKELCTSGSALRKEIENYEDLDEQICEVDSKDKLQAEVLRLIQSMIKLKSMDIESLSSSQQTETGKKDDTELDTEGKDSLCVEEKVNCDESVLMSPKTPSCTRTRKPDIVTPSTPFTDSERQKLQQVFVGDVFRSYIHLLVNSRSQVALARVFNIPDRGLDHMAFTHLKHEASTAGLSMYQALSSFMLRIQLGGKGYAPPSESPLMAHLKGLGNLLDFMQKLQAVVEEDPCVKSACKRVVNIIKNNLINCKSGKFPRSVVEPVAEALHKKLSYILEQNAELSPEKDVSSGGSVLGRKCLNTLRSFLDWSAIEGDSQLHNHFIRDVRFSTQTPSRFPSMLSQFRSPGMLEFGEDDDLETESMSPLNSDAKQTSKCSNFVSSALYFDEGPDSGMLCTQRTLSSMEVLPSKTIAHPRPDSPCPKTSNEIIEKPKLSESTVAKIDSKRKATKGEGRKRKICAEAAHEKENATTSHDGSCDEKKSKVVKGKGKGKANGGDTPVSSKAPAQRAKKEKTENPKSTSCRRRLLPQVKGQAKITGFFR